MATYEYTTQDVEYLRHGDRKFMARLFKPQGKGPFPAVVEVHGGAWCNGDLNECQIYAEGFARAGLAVASIDFRHAADGYPTSLADINYAIRWVKANASELNTRADLVGIAGQSSGGHLAMLAAMRPNDPRYAAIQLPSVGAGGGCDGARGGDAVAGDQPAVALSPCVAGARFGESAGLGRQHSAAARHVLEDRGQHGRGQSDADPGARRKGADAAGDLDPGPAGYRARLSRSGSPIPGNEPERFVTNYRKAGGEIDLLYVDNAKKAGAPSFEPAAAFFHRYIKV